LAANETKHIGTTIDRAEVQEVVRRQEAAQIRTQAREAAHVEAWAQARARIRGALVLTVLAALAVGVVIGYYGLGSPQDGTSQGVTPPERWSQRVEENRIGGDVSVVSATMTPWPVRVYVSGAVVEAQIVELPPGSLVADALKAAGGMTENADHDAINLAAPLFDNQHILVPTRRAPSQDAGTEEDLPTARINLNTASADELQLLPSIGDVRAHAIVRYRETYGPFQEVDDILFVPGIGPSIYERIAPYITVDP
jgi:competence protein ComEA